MMKEYYYKGFLAGKELHFAFRHKETAFYFGNYLIPSEPVGDEIRVPASDCDIWSDADRMEDNAYTEYSMFAYRTSDALFPYDRFLFHAAAMQWHGKAWLFAADSGTGKSTQLRHWQSLYGGEIEIINGDKPALKKESDGTFTVCPSPWKGKERLGSDTISAPLAGIILLEKGSRNELLPLSPYHAARPLLTCLFSAFETEQSLRQLSRLEDELIRSTSLWRLTNLGDEASAVITHEALNEIGAMDV